MRNLRGVGELANLNSEATLLLSFAVTRVMSILKYFKRVDIAAALPDPKGPLSDQVPLASISEANKEVMKTIAAVDKEPQKKGPYLKVTPEYKAKIAKFASINGNCVAARKYTKLLGKNLNESTVRSWVKNYKSELERKRKAGEPDPDVQVLPVAKRGALFCLERSWMLKRKRIFELFEMPEVSLQVALQLQLARLSCVNTIQV